MKTPTGRSFPPLPSSPSPGDFAADPTGAALRPARPRGHGRSTHRARPGRGRLAAVALACACASWTAIPAGAADRTILGERLVVKDPDGANPARRRIVLSALERNSPDPISGDPTGTGSTRGGLLQVVAEGGTPSSQIFVLPQGTARNGKPFWRAAAPSGFRYADPRGEQGPVRSVLVTRTRTGTFKIRVTLSGKPGGLEIVPPDPGTAAFLTLSLGTGDRYCVRYGSDGTVKNDGGRSFTVRNLSVEGCPATVAGDLLALTYNVAGLPEGISGSHPATNTPIISPLLNGYDLVVVQESWQTPDPNPLAPLRVYHELLVAHALHPFRSISAINPINTDPFRPSAILGDGLNNLSRFPFEDVIRVPWNGCYTSAADCLALKGFSLARTRFAPGVVVDVYDLHMEAGGAPQDDALRDAGVSQLRDFVNAHSAGRAIVVGGDFNLHTDEEPDASQFQRLLAETGLIDVCAALGCPEPGRIDKFLYRDGGGVTITPQSWRFETDVFVDGAGDPLSDHEALAVRFAWSAAGS